MPGKRLKSNGISNTCKLNIFVTAVCVFSHLLAGGALAQESKGNRRALKSRF